MTPRPSSGCGGHVTHSSGRGSRAKLGCLVPLFASNHVQLGDLGDFSVPGGVHDDDPHQAEGGGRLLAVHLADRGAAVPLLPARRDVPV